MDFGIRIFSYLELQASVYRRKYLQFYTESFIFPSETTQANFFVSASVLKTRIEGLPFYSGNLPDYPVESNCDLLGYSGSLNNIFFIEPDLEYKSYGNLGDSFERTPLLLKKRMKLVLNRNHAIFYTSSFEYISFLGTFVCDKLGLPCYTMEPAVNFFLSNVVERKTKIKGEIISTTHYFDGTAFSTKRNNFLGDYIFIHEKSGDEFSFNHYDNDGKIRRNLSINTVSASSGINLIINGWNRSNLLNFKTVQCEKFVFNGYVLPTAVLISSSSGNSINGNIWFSKMNGAGTSDVLSCRFWITKTANPSIVLNALSTSSYQLVFNKGIPITELELNKISEVLTENSSSFQALNFVLTYVGSNPSVPTGSVYFNLSHGDRWFQWSSSIKKE